MEKLIIDAMGAGLGIFATLVLFETFWVYRNVKKVIFIAGILINATASVLLTVFLQNDFVLPILALILKLSLSYFFYAGFAYRVLLALLNTAIALIAEIIIGFIQVQVLAIALEQIQTSMPTYMFGVLASNIFALFVVFMIKVFAKGKKQEVDKKFNLLMAFMPIQSLMLCYIVLFYSLRADAQETSPLGLAAIFLSIALIVITMIILDKQRVGLIYKNEYELAQAKLKVQIEHYQDMYREQQRVKSIRHDISNNLVAISGLVKAGQMQEAVDKINEISETVIKSAYVIDTGFPPIDAIMSAKLKKAKDFDIDMTHSVIVDGELHIDQFDIAAIIANALDNAIEGALRSERQDKAITLNISRTADYISILVENYTEGPICNNFQTTKSDKKNHGFGMTQMRGIVQKYGGVFRPSYDLNERKFSLTIILKNQPP